MDRRRVSACSGRRCSPACGSTASPACIRKHHAATRYARGSAAVSSPPRLKLRIARSNTFRASRAFKIAILSDPPRCRSLAETISKNSISSCIFIHQPSRPFRIREVQTRRHRKSHGFCENSAAQACRSRSRRHALWARAEVPPAGDRRPFCRELPNFGAGHGICPRCRPGQPSSSAAVVVSSVFSVRNATIVIG